jgi:hypothetical protein
MAGATVIEQQLRERLRTEWTAFCERRTQVLHKLQSGLSLKERDVELIFQALAEGPLGWELGQLSLQSDHADYALIDRGLKLGIVETKTYRYFQQGEHRTHIEETLKQAARYADRHRTPHVMAFDGDLLIFGRREPERSLINVHLQIRVDYPEPLDDLFYVTRYGIFRHPTSVLYAFPYDAEGDEALFKVHHGVRLHYSCFAFVGDLRDKKTWIAPYRNADGSVDTQRLGHAVNYLLSPGGYRGQKASSERIPEAATPLVALRLARAYLEIGKWKKPDRLFGGGKKPDPQSLLWTYLYQNGLEESVDLKDR